MQRTGVWVQFIPPLDGVRHPWCSVHPSRIEVSEHRIVHVVCRSWFVWTQGLISFSGNTSTTIIRWAALPPHKPFEKPVNWEHTEKRYKRVANSKLEKPTKTTLTYFGAHAVDWNSHFPLESAFLKSVWAQPWCVYPGSENTETKVKSLRISEYRTVKQ